MASYGYWSDLRIVNYKVLRLIFVELLFVELLEVLYIFFHIQRN